jgi:hypothetical protein
MATCPAGTLVLGGGFTLGGALLQVTAVPTDNQPAGTTAWTATARNYATGAVDFTVQAFAVCTA